MEGMSTPLDRRQFIAATGFDPDKLRDVSAKERFDAVVYALQGVIEPAARCAAAVEIFGRRGVELSGYLHDDLPPVIPHELYAACSAKLAERIGGCCEAS